jgi:nucleoside-diphosphate-sugar epimerase
MTSLVTGATGFIGRHLVAHLTGQAVMRRAIEGAHVVYHCAAAHSTSPAEDIRRTNLKSVQALFDALRGAKSAARVILMSSINVLGNGSYANANEELPRRRTKDLHVDLKIAAEELAEKAIADGVNVVVLRPGLVYGPGDHNLQKLAQAIYLGKFMFIGSRDNVVPLVHVSDMVQAMVLAAKATDASRHWYNITDGSQTTIGQLVGGLARVMECPEPQRVMPAVVPRLANSVCGWLGRNGPVSPSALRFLGTSRHVDIGRARRELGFEPRVGIAEGLQGMANWLREATAAESAA